MYIFGMVNPSQQRRLAPVFTSTYEHRSESSQFSIGLAVAADHLCVLDYSERLEPTFIDRQAELGQGQSRNLMQFEFPARISYHTDGAKIMLKPAKADQETFGKGQQIKRCPTVKPGFK